ncbi:MAG: hypothetical protein ACI4QX_00715 [Lachnospiraceae bacterium]
MKKKERKKISFVLFVMAVFFAGVVLAEFHSSVWLVIIAGVVLTAASCFFIWERETKEQNPSEKTAEILLADRMAEYMRSNEKAEKGVYIAVKKQHEAMAEGMSALEGKLSEVIKAQESAVKTLILYNKENARQLALSEREELGHLREELQRTVQTGFDGMAEQMQNKEFIRNAAAPVVEALKETTHRIYEELHENGEATLSELESTVDGVGEIKELLTALEENTSRLNELMEVMQKFPAVPVAATTPEPEVMAEPEPVEESEAEVVAEPEDKLAASGVDLSDPNKTLSADDIAALFAAANGTEEAAAEPEVVEEPEDKLAASGVDLSDPNKTLSADDIAALFAAANGTEEATAEPEAVTEPEPVEEPEPEAVEEPEDKLAASGVDLSDPNKTLSADDIAALFAAMNN